MAWSELVADGSEEVVPGFCLVRALHIQGREAVDDAEDAAPLVGLGDEDLKGVCGGAEDAGDFRALFDGVEEVDGEAVFEDDDEEVT